MTLKNIGLALLVWGAVGVVNQMLMMQSSTTGAPTSVPYIGTIDPANLFQITNPSGAGITSPGMLTDAAILGVGSWLALR